MKTHLLTLTIPTIIALLSYIWYHRKKRVKTKHKLEHVTVMAAAPEQLNNFPYQDSPGPMEPAESASSVLTSEEELPPESSKSPEDSSLGTDNQAAPEEDYSPLPDATATQLVESFQESCRVESPSDLPSTSCLLDASNTGNHSDVNSEGSNDSGRGGSDIVSGESGSGGPTKVRFEFELPQELCGRFIGKQGKNVTSIKSQSNTRISIKRHPLNINLKLCSIEGTESEVQTALELIRSRFPLASYPAITLLRVNPTSPFSLLQTTLQLPVEVPVCVILSSMVTAGHFFLQQPTHPSHPSLAHLNRQMLAFYSHMDTPLLPVPLPAPGAICAAPVISGWFRAQVVSAVDEDTQECDIKFLDYGGYIRIHISMLRQIWSDFMVLPFQATECYLADVVPNTEDGLWSAKACEVFEELAQGQILQAVVVGFAEDGVPCVELHKVQGETNVFINKELVDLNLAQWASTSP